MNIVDIIIIGVALVSVLIVVIVITRSLKHVDKEIVHDIKNGSSDEKKLLVRMKQSMLYFAELAIGKLRSSMQKLHSWAIREKRKSKSDVIKARDEFMIKKEEGIKKETSKDMEDSATRQGNKKIDKKRMVKDISLQKEDIVIDSVAKNNKQNKNNFIKSLFKRNNKKRKNVDIKKGKEKTASEWSLEGVATETNGINLSNLNNENKAFSKMEDTVLGVDRKILEKKILQRIDKDPKNIDSYHELGSLYIKMKKYDDAMEVFGYILGVEPNDIEAKRRQDKIKLLKKAHN